ncbi:YczE/YyaS/YitT family protein [Kineosporia mesophila]|uniref:YczE/YyaS/YitT family protein n=1 Tax=Kineosporia mesophila TaxID=566012 RepID=UPI001E513F86|nr:hypothetical protein [Kineosporia mesophila]MCD5352501.1 hypothetical protein [Kineosporia mesophila]
MNDSSTERPIITPGRIFHLVASCVVLGAGVALFLLASLGSDGYSTLISGLTDTSGLPFMVVNISVGVVFVIMAWLRGTRPGLGTVTQPVVVGLTVSLLLAWLDTPDSMVVRIVMLIAAVPVLAIGVAGYLGSGTGAGPAEAAALAWDPPVPFRWSYSILQGGGALVGWLLGGAVGPGTILVILVLGPAIDLATRRVPGLVYDRTPQPA